MNIELQDHIDKGAIGRTDGDLEIGTLQTRHQQDGQVEQREKNELSNFLLRP